MGLKFRSMNSNPEAQKCWPLLTFLRSGGCAWTLPIMDPQPWTLRFGLWPSGHWMIDGAWYTASLNMHVII